MDFGQKFQRLIRLISLFTVLLPALFPLNIKHHKYEDKLFWWHKCHPWKHFSLIPNITRFYLYLLLFYMIIMLWWHKLMQISKVMSRNVMTRRVASLTITNMIWCQSQFLFITKLVIPSTFLSAFLKLHPGWNHKTRKSLVRDNEIQLEYHFTYDHFKAI